MQEVDKKKMLNSLKTAKGQLEGVIRMIEDERYCVDISKQILAVQALIKKSNMVLLNQHVKGCVKTAIIQGGGEEEINEIFEIIERYAK
jgi:CsoR family transcriptional regulator, copper-sensing transcriptional repressor